MTQQPLIIIQKCCFFCYCIICIYVASTTLYLKIAYFSYRCLVDDNLQAFIFALLRRVNAQIFLIQETCSDPHEKSIWAESGRLIKQYLIHPFKTINLILVQSFYCTNINNDGRVIAAKSKQQKFLVNPINIFVPTSSSSISVRNDVFI